MIMLHTLVASNQFKDESLFILIRKHTIGAAHKHAQIRLTLLTLFQQPCTGKPSSPYKYKQRKYLYIFSFVCFYPILILCHLFKLLSVSASLPTICSQIP